MKLASKDVLLSGIACGCLAFAVYWLTINLEYYEEVVDKGWSQQARSNPYLAAEKYLQKSGLQVSSTHNLKSLDQLPVNGAIFISNSRKVLSRERSETLIDWMLSGGHIIATAHLLNEGESDPLLDRFNIYLETTDCDCDTPTLTLLEDSKDAVKTTPKPETEEQDDIDSNKTAFKKLSETMREHNRRILERIARRKEKATQQQTQKTAPSTENTDSSNTETTVEKQDSRSQYAARIPAERLTILQFEGVEGKLTANFSPYYSLFHPALYQPSGDEETVLDEATTLDSTVLDSTVLAGETALHDSAKQTSAPQPFYWTGSHYGYHFIQFKVGEGLLSVVSDNNIWRSDEIGHFDNAHLLTVLTSYSDEVLLMFGTDVPSLWQQLQALAPEALCSLALWLLAWLIYRARRFGPIHQQNISVRRSMAEHIYACADFLWQQREQQHLLNSVREDTLRRIQQRHPTYQNLNRSGQVALLTQTTKLSAEDIQSALFAPAPKNETQFTRTITLLQMLWKKL